MIPVSYLVHSCGLSPAAAIEASHKVKLKSLANADSVLALFRRYEFSDAQKTLLPKLEFLSSIGMSSLDLVKVVSYSTLLTHRSLENNIKPCYTYLKRWVISDAKVCFILKHHSWFFWRIHVTGFIRLVTELGMPSNCIAYLLKCYTRIVTGKHQVLSPIVSNVKRMGFDPVKLYLCKPWAYYPGGKGHGELRKRCIRGGDGLRVILVFPLCMVASEEKIMGIMQLLVNKMGWESRKVAEYPYVFWYSLEKRIIPSRVLLLRGLIEEKTDFG